MRRARTGLNSSITHTGHPTSEMKLPKMSTPYNRSLSALVPKGKSIASRSRLRVVRGQSKGRILRQAVVFRISRKRKALPIVSRRIDPTTE